MGNIYDSDERLDKICAERWTWWGLSPALIILGLQARQYKELCNQHCSTLCVHWLHTEWLHSNLKPQILTDHGFLLPASAADRSDRVHGRQRQYSLPFSGEAYHPIKLFFLFKVNSKCGRIMQDSQPNFTIFDPSSQERPFLRTQINSPSEKEENAASVDPVSLTVQL